MTTPVSETIYASRDAIRTQVIDLLQQYMELNEVDLTQSSFLSYIIDIMTMLTSNLMFYQSNVYKEFFLTQAQLPESIHNLSSFLGYTPAEANYSVANILMTVGLPFTDPNTIFNIPSGFKFSTADGTTFVTYYSITVSLTNNTSVSISAEQDGKIFDVPVAIDTVSEQSSFEFVLPVRQYKTTIEETGIDEDLQPYQFTDIDIPIDGKVSSLKVYVRDPNASTDSSGNLYTLFSSLYLMSNSDYGYVMRVSAAGRKLYFGNGIIGKQPLPGSTVIVHINETEGLAGNVIAGSITTGERIYSQQNGETTIINYDVINPSPAYNGKDEEDLQEIRSNSIKSLVSLNRLVSEQDYKNFDVVVPNAPIKSNSIPILKRSDLKINEIQLYTIFEYGTDIVPSRNTTYQVPSSTTYLPRNLVINENGEDYITLFEMTLESINEAAYYHYIMRQIQLVPLLVESWTYSGSPIYHFHVNNLVVDLNDSTSTAVFELSYYSNEPDFDTCECTMSIMSTDDTFNMINVPGTGGGIFNYTFTNYLDIPQELQTYEFTITNLATIITDIETGATSVVRRSNSQYTAEFTVRKELQSFMISNTVDDGTNTTIYDIPIIKKSYYDSVDQVDFETIVLQGFINSTELKNYRMLTDFNNIKLCNTTGLSTNMLLNDSTKTNVKDIGLSSIPAGEIRDRYIVSGIEGGEWNNHRDHIAMCIDSTANIYTFIEPKDNDIVYVDSKESNYVYSDLGWKVPIYDIPLKISVEVFKENDSSIDEGTLISNIRSSLMEYYKPMFGAAIDIRRSKIIDLVHNVSGVSYCRLIKPETGIFFDFNINDFNQQELLNYSPDWLYFSEDDITIKIFTME
jgi:hypothetical protein